jgi:predicted MPP superfamily phosphohydrolase
MPAVLLAHDPVLFPEAAERGVDLVLSGHTHGGRSRCRCSRAS